MAVNGRKRVRLLLIGLLLLAIGFGALGFAVHGTPRPIAEVTLAKVTWKPDRLWVDVSIKMRDKTKCSLIDNDEGVHSVRIDTIRRGKNDESILDWYLRPSSDRGKLSFAFELKAGEDLEVHLPTPRISWLRSGEEVVLISSSRPGAQVRSVSLRAETIE